MSLPTLESVGLSFRELVAIGKDLNPKGTFGIDAERVKSKAELVMFLEGKYDPAAIAGALGRMFPGREAAAAPAPVVVADEPRNVTPKPPVVEAKAGDALANLAEALAGVVALGSHAAPIDEEAVRVIVAQELAQQAPREIVVRVGAAAPVPATGANPLATKVAALAANGINVALTGPAGTGKTTLGKVVAKMLGRPFSSISLSAGITEAHLLGRLLPIGEGGRFHWVPSPFLMRYAGMRLDYSSMNVVEDAGEVGVFTFDEFDAADPNMILVVNSATANGGFDVEGRLSAGLDAHVLRAEGCSLLANLNTYGTGATAQYVGRGALDAATLDRWYMVSIEYDAAFEASIFGSPAPLVRPWEPVGEPSQGELRDLGAWCDNVRAAVRERGMKRIVSTRFMQKAAAARAAGVSTDEVKRDLLTGWTRDELGGLGALAPAGAK